MRKITGLLFLSILFCLPQLFAQVSSFPYNEGFEGTFTTGTAVDFIPNWNGNEVQTSSRIFRDGANMRTGSGALAVIPISSFAGTIILSLDFSAVTGANANFWARSAVNGTGTRPAIVKVAVSIDGGTSWSTDTQIGVDATFANANTAYVNYNYVFPVNTDNAPSVKMRMVVSQGAVGSGTTARFVMDDFLLSAGGSVDITPPTITAATALSSTQLDVLFSEPVEQVSAETESNYSVDNGIGNPSSALRDGANHGLVHLVFANSFASGTTYTLTVNNIADTAANVILANSTKTFSIDITPPALTSAVATGATLLDVKFSEPADQASAETNANYTVDNGIGNPSAAARDGSDPSLVHLTFANSFSGGTTYTLSVSNVKDIALNTIAPNSTTTFTYSTPGTPLPYDVVITEFMADPDPAIGLPNAEFIEIYNRSNKTFDLNGWKISDSGSPHDLTAFQLKPDSFLILTGTTNAAAFAAFGSAMGVTSFPSLNNTGGDDVVLYDNNSVIIDKVHYDESYYADASKADGGWSIERIDPDFTCTSKLNWRASVDVSGGTPGRMNSVDAAFVDNSSPRLLRACLDDSVHVTLFFSEPIAETELSNVQNYMISETDVVIPGDVVLATPAADGMSVTLTLLNSAATGIWTVLVTSTVSDCAGNPISGNEVSFAAPVAATPGDIIFNEVLFSVDNGAVEFAELYNASSKVIDLSTLEINNYSITSGNPNTPQQLSAGCYLMFPAAYLVLSDDAEAIKAHYVIKDQDAFLDMSFPDLLTEEDIVVLKNISSEVIDSLHYYSSWHFPLLNDVHNISLERLRASSPTNDAQNWHSASENSGFATPGYENSQRDETGSGTADVTIEPEVFSPDNDGKNDVVNILFHFPDPGYLASVKVFDSHGRPVRTLIENQLLGNDGVFSWDGVSDEKEKARTGIYILYIEVFNINGDVKKYKKTCVLATKL